MELNLDVMQSMLRQVPVLIITMTAIATLASVSQRRKRLVLEQQLRREGQHRDGLIKDRESFT